MMRSWCAAATMSLDCTHEHDQSWPHLHTAHSATGRFSIQWWPQNGRGIRGGLFFPAVKSSLLAGVLRRTMLKALSTFSSCQIAMPPLPALCNVCRLPTTSSRAHPHSAQLAHLAAAQGTKLRFWPYIEMDRI